MNKSNWAESESAMRSEIVRPVKLTGVITVEAFGLYYISMLRVTSVFCGRENGSLITRRMNKKNEATKARTKNDSFYESEEEWAKEEAKRRKGRERERRFQMICANKLLLVFSHWISQSSLAFEIKTIEWKKMKGERERAKQRSKDT